MLLAALHPEVGVGVGVSVSVDVGVGVGVLCKKVLSLHIYGCSYGN